MSGADLGNDRGSGERAPAGQRAGAGAGAIARAATVAALATGLLLGLDSIRAASATYDEVTYVDLAADWWRNGESFEITRMGSPLTFWKWQNAPAMALCDAIGRSEWVDDPDARLTKLLPMSRAWSLIFWLIAGALTAIHANRAFGPRAMTFAAWFFALSPNLLAHGALITMESPLVAASAAAFLAHDVYRKTGRRSHLAMVGAAIGVAFSMKFTAVLYPPALSLLRFLDLRREGVAIGAGLRRSAGYLAALVGLTLATNLVLTGGARVPLSARVGDHPVLERVPAGWPRAWAARILETPIPADWVGFATQMGHQRSGGPSYLLGERRMTGWWWYYPAALLFKVPTTLWIAMAARIALERRIDPRGDRRWLAYLVLIVLAVACAGSTRNYGARYLLPLAPPTIVWMSGLATRSAGGAGLGFAVLGLAGQLAAAATTHPHHLTHFAAALGGPERGSRALSDSNFDWGQGLIGFAALQRERPELRDATLYYFGEARPRAYGVAGRIHVVNAHGSSPPLPDHPERDSGTPFVAVSSSLLYGPWGPFGRFDAFREWKPIARTADGTILVFRNPARDEGAGVGDATGSD